MSICSICDDTGIITSDSTDPKFCYCSAGKQARRQWEASRTKEKSGSAAPSFIDIGQLDQVNASVDAMRASLLGPSSAQPASTAKHPAVQLLLRVAHPGHEISPVEATQLHDLAQALEGFLSALAPIGRNQRR